MTFDLSLVDFSISLRRHKLKYFPDLLFYPCVSVAWKKRQSDISVTSQVLRFYQLAPVSSHTASSATLLWQCSTTSGDIKITASCRVRAPQVIESTRWCLQPETGCVSTFSHPPQMKPKYLQKTVCAVASGGWSRGGTFICSTNRESASAVNHDILPCFYNIK